jgi:hypothetical protein
MTISARRSEDFVDGYLLAGITADAGYYDICRQVHHVIMPHNAPPF